MRKMGERKVMAGIGPLPIFEGRHFMNRRGAAEDIRFIGAHASDPEWERFISKTSRAGPLRCASVTRVILPSEVLTPRITYRLIFILLLMLGMPGNL